MNFVTSSSAVSNKARITIFNSGCTQAITISNANNIKFGSVPVRLDYFNAGTTVPNATISPSAYATGLDVSVTSTRLIPDGRYPVTITGETADRAVNHQRTLYVDVKNVKPVITEF